MAIGTAAAILGGSLIGGATSLIGSKKAASAAQQAQDTATAESRRQFDLVREDTAGQRALGDSALARIRQMYGYGGTPEQPAAPDMSGFFTSPDYQFNLGEGQQAIDRSAAARGGLLSGRAVKEGQRFASGLASREFSGYMDRLLQQAGIGSTGIGASAAAGSNAASNIGSAALNAGNLRSSAYMAGATGVNNAAQGGLGNYLMAKYLGV